MVYLKRIFLFIIVLFVVQSLYVAAEDNSAENKKYAVDTLYKTVDELYNSGVQCFLDKQYDKAVEIFSEVIKQIPNDEKNTRWMVKNSSSYFNRGMAYCRLEQYNKAIADFSTAIELVPTSDVAYFNRGLAYYYSRQYDKAIADFSRSIKLNPNKNEAYDYRGAAYYDSGQYDKAIADFSHLIKVIPDNDGAYNYNYRGAAYYDSGQYDKAIADFSQSIKLNPNNDRVFYYRGMAYCGLRQYDKAMKDFSIATEGYADFGRAKVYYELKQYANAIKSYSQALELWKNAQLKECPEIIVAYLNIMKICIIDGKPNRFSYWLEQFEKNISTQDLDQEDKMIKLYLILVNKCVMNKPLENTEKELDQLLEDNKTIKANWSCELVDEWLKEPKNGLSSKQKKYIQALTDKIKVYSLKK